MATFVDIADFLEDMGKKVHNLSSDTIQIALSNTAPGSETNDPTASGNGVLANVTQIAYTNYADDLTTDRVMENVTWAETGGVSKFDFDDFLISASGGALADFRYIYIFNQTATNDPLIALIDNGSVISLASGESRQVTVNASGLFTNGPAA